MSKKLVQHIKKMSTATNPTDNRTTSETVGGNLSGSSDPLIAAQGALVSGSSKELNITITDDENAKKAALAATATKMEQNKTTAQAYNAAADVVEQQMPNDPTGWTKLAFAVTSEEANDMAPPDKVIGGNMTQGAYLGTAQIKFKRPARAEDFSARITVGDPTIDANYIQVEKPALTYSKATFTIQVPLDYQNLPLWMKVTAINGGGKSPESDSFGGIKIS